MAKSGGSAWEKSPCERAAGATGNRETEKVVEAIKEKDRAKEPQGSPGI